MSEKHLPDEQQMLREVTKLQSRISILEAKNASLENTVSNSLLAYQDVIQTLTAENARLRKTARFGLKVLAMHRKYIGDIDGWDLQDEAIKCGLLEERTVTEPCGDYCDCSDFPTQCYFETDEVTQMKKELDL